MAASTATTTSYAAKWESDEWEVVNDDGFVYKRKKRRLDPTSFIPAPDPESDPALEFKERRIRKRAVLLNLKEKYLREILLWENLSTAFNTMEHTINSNFKEKHIADETQGPKLQMSGHKRIQSVISGPNSTASLLHQLLLQVEAQEAIIRSFEKLCDVADSLCNAQEEKDNQQFFDIPIWHSPLELMTSLQV